MTNKFLAMKLLVEVMTIIFASLLNISSASFLILNQSLEYQVQVGNSETFVYTKVYNRYSNKQNEFLIEVETKEGELVNITVMYGTTITYTVTQIIDRLLVKGTITYNDNITTKEVSFNELCYYVSTTSTGRRFCVLRPTIDNRTYWEEFCSNNSDYAFINQTILEMRETFLLPPAGSINQMICFQWDWRTGWETYRHIKMVNNTHLLYEQERNSFSSKENNIRFENLFGLVFLIFSFVLIAGLVYYQKKKK